MRRTGSIREGQKKKREDFFSGWITILQIPNH